MKNAAKKVFDLFHDTTFLRRFHGWATIFWLLASVPIVLFLSESVAFIVFISCYAVVGAHWSSWQASRVEEKQDAEIDEVDEDVEQVGSGLAEHRDKTEPKTDDKE